MRIEATKLWKQAENELEVSEALIKAFQYAAASFHAQQAAEMALKAVNVEQTGLLSSEHKLFDLARRLGAPESVFRAAAHLGPVYVETRYFDARADKKVPSDEYTEDDATAYFNEANEVLTWSEQQLMKSGSAATRPRSTSASRSKK